MAKIFGNENDVSTIKLTTSISPQDISSEAEALILMAPPVQIFDTSIFNTQYSKETALYKRYLDNYDYYNRGISRDQYNKIMRDANGIKVSGVTKDATGTIYIPFMRCMIQCTYVYHNSGCYERNPDAITFNAFGFQNQNIGSLNPSRLGSGANGFNKSPSNESIMYNVVRNELDQVIANPENNSETIITGRTINSWYYSTKTGLTIRYDPSIIFIEDLRVVVF